MRKKENFVFYIFVRVSVPQKMCCKVEQSKLALQKVNLANERAEI